MTVFERQRLIRFSDCDPAGIVFFPQYFVMLNGLVEDWINDEADGLGVGYSSLITGRRIGLPTVRLEAEFKAVSRFGDNVVLSLDVERLGESSMTLLIACRSANGAHGAHGAQSADGADAAELRMQVRQVIVATSLDTHRSTPIPSDLRAAIASRLARHSTKESS